MIHSSRRKFFATAASLSMASAQQAELPRKPPQDLELVRTIVQLGHNDQNLARVKEMLAQNPKLVIASWDWGEGDWETALGGAAHTGSREMARLLLSQGARIDSFCAAMLGHRDTMRALIAATPSVATVPGPHGFTLLYHAAISGDVAIAELIKPHLAANARDFNQSVAAAARDGRLEMITWLFKNGATAPKPDNAAGNQPLKIAVQKGFTEVAAELRKHGFTD